MIGYRGAGCLVFYYDKKTGHVFVLLGKRTSGVGAGQWSIPGGGWEEKDGYCPDGETPDYIVTARRELEEEVGLKTNSQYTRVKVWSTSMPFFHYEVYAVRLSGRKFIKHFSREFSKVGWFRADQLPKNKFFFLSAQVNNLLHIMRKRGYPLAEEYNRGI